MKSKNRNKGQKEAKIENEEGKMITNKVENYDENYTKGKKDDKHKNV